MRGWGIDVCAKGNGGRALLRGDASGEPQTSIVCTLTKGSMKRPWKVWKQPKCPSTDGWITTVLESHTMEYYLAIKRNEGASLVVQWLRIRLPVQGTRVRALVREDPTCCGATGHVRYNYWDCALEPTSHNYWAHRPTARAPQQEKPPRWVAPAHCK